MMRSEGEERVRKAVVVVECLVLNVGNETEIQAPFASPSQSPPKQTSPNSPLVGVWRRCGVWVVASLRFHATILARRAPSAKR